jgi:hypothetical protein
MAEGFGIAVVAAVLIVFGWIAAHDTVARECNQMGMFYVGKKVYECKPKEKANG